MPTYLVTYHGAGGPPASPEARDQMMAAFGAWVASVGDHMVDPGAPLGASKTVSAEGVSDGAPGAGVGGYSLIKAADLDKPLRDPQDSDGDGGTVLKPAPPQPLADNRGMGWHWSGVGIKN